MRHPSTKPSPAVARLVRGALASLGMLALLERAVGDLAQQAGVVVQGADMAPVELVGVRVKVVIAQGFQAFQHRVDLELGVMKASRALALSVGRQVVMAWSPGVSCIVSV